MQTWKTRYAFILHSRTRFGSLLDSCAITGYDQRMRMSKEPEFIEGPEAFRRFDNLVGALIAVPREEILRREAAYKRISDANPRKRGPKRKPSAASPGAAEPKI